MAKSRKSKKYGLLTKHQLRRLFIADQVCWLFGRDPNDLHFYAGHALRVADMLLQHGRYVPNAEGRKWSLELENKRVGS